TARDADEDVLVQPVEIGGRGLDLRCSTEDVFIRTDVLAASETREDLRAPVAHGSRLDVEQIAASGGQRVADVAERGAVWENDLPVGACSGEEFSAELRSAECPAGQW